MKIKLINTLLTQTTKRQLIKIKIENKIIEISKATITDHNNNYITTEWNAIENKYDQIINKLTQHEKNELKDFITNID